MKKIKKFICKISPAIIASFTLALSINANSSTCFFMYQPKMCIRDRRTDKKLQQKINDKKQAQGLKM